VWCVDGRVTTITAEHRADHPAEKARIMYRGGTVKQLVDPDTLKPAGPFRVFRPNAMLPGLAITRSIGDSDSRDLGITATPSVTTYTLDPGKP
jgi:serine/threonine protein phosphatase PrpC